MAEDWMPTTADVREDYQNGRPLPPVYSPNFRPALDARGAEFDRWLAAHDAEQRAAAWDAGVDARATDAVLRRPLAETKARNPYRPYRTEAPHA